MRQPGIENLLRVAEPLDGILWPAAFQQRFALDQLGIDALLRPNIVAELLSDGQRLRLSGRSLQQSDANQTSVEVYVSVSSTLKH